MDAFGTAITVPKLQLTALAMHAPVACAGPLLLSFYAPGETMDKPERPPVCYRWWFKVSTKTDCSKLFVKLLTNLLLVVASRTHSSQQLVNVGKSLYEADPYRTAKN